MKRKTKVLGLLILFLTIFIGIGLNANETVRSYLGIKESRLDGYHGQSLLVRDLENQEDFIEKRPDKRIIPASLSKLFVIDFASSILDLDEIIVPREDVFNLVKEGSSMAGLEEKAYSVENIYAAMLVPSGNDAAYVLADAVGSVLEPEAFSVEERQEVFLKEFNAYLMDQGINDTDIYDPSGYDDKSRTTTKDLVKVTQRLLEHDWFRSMVKQSTYVATLPDGSIETWKNTNIYLDEDNEDYYNPGVKGVKTGSLNEAYNLVVLYEHQGKEFLIISLGSDANMSRYDDVFYVIDEINQESSHFK